MKERRIVVQFAWEGYSFLKMAVLPPQLRRQINYTFNNNYQWLFCQDFLRSDLVLTYRLRDARKKKGFTQRQLAQLCNFGVNQISLYEKGAIDPTSESLKILVQHLDVSADYLLGLTDELQGVAAPSDLQPDEREILDMYRHEGWPGVIRLGGERLSK